ncbi:MAG: hypothetical protein QOD99_2913 [Chthoniobacter sp.]|jgi:hypothetical protein|nr:hypothetical protein [Chthoniobacter sp.]
MKTKLICIFTILVTCAAPHCGFAAGVATDSATDAAYNDGWQTGDNGGSGWGSVWTLTPSGAGATFSTGNSAGNGDGDTSAPTGDINTPQDASGRAWALAASTGFTADAFRLFDGPLSVGQTFLIDCDTGTLTSGTQAGLRLENASGNALWEFHFNANSFSYIISDGGGSSIKFGTVTDEGVHLAFTLTSATNYSVSMTPLGSSSATTRNSTLISAVGGPDIARFHLFFTGNAPSTTANQQFFNSTAVVPEPGTTGLLILGCTLLAIRRGLTVDPRHVVRGFGGSGGSEFRAE